MSYSFWDKFKYSINLFRYTLMAFTVLDWSVFFIGVFFFLFLKFRVLSQINIFLLPEVFVFIASMLIWLQIIINNNYGNTFKPVFTPNQFFVRNQRIDFFRGIRLGIPQITFFISLSILFFNFFLSLLFFCSSTNYFVIAFGALKITGSIILFKFFLSLFLFLLISFINKSDHVLADENYIFFLFMYLASSLLISSNTIITLFVAFEWLSLIFIIISASVSKSQSFKSYTIVARYFIVSTFASILILISVAFIFLFFGTFHIDAIKAINISANPYSIYFLSTIPNNLILIFFSVGFFIKIGIFPFHVWILDVYNYVSIFFLLILVSFAKISYFFVFNLFFYTFYFPHSVNFFFSWLSLLTMFSGATLAFTQKSIKKIFISFSIFNSGFVLFTLSTLSTTNSIFFSYLIIESLLFFVLILLLSVFSSTCTDINQYKDKSITYTSDLGRIFPYTARYIISLILLTLSGLPPFGLFIFKISILVDHVYSGFGFFSIFFVFIFLIIMTINLATYVRLIQHLIFYSPTSFSINKSTKFISQPMNFNYFSSFTIKNINFWSLFLMLLIIITILLVFELRLITILFEYDDLGVYFTEYK